MTQKLLLITPPFTQLNTPYPATAYLKGFLNTKNIESNQCDLGIETILALYSAEGLSAVFREIERIKPELSANGQRMCDLHTAYVQTINPVISFLQGKNAVLAHLICDGKFLPEASRFRDSKDLEWAFGTMGIYDKAKHLATLYLEDISDLIVEAIDANFGVNRYAERLGRSAATFDKLEAALTAPDTFIDRLLLHLLEKKIDAFGPTLVALSVPFPGNLYSAFKCGQWIKAHFPKLNIVMGGGFANTELRSLSDSRVFNYIDFLTLDDGAAPMLQLIEYLDGNRNKTDLKRTFAIENGQVSYFNGSTTHDFSQAETGTPDYTGFSLDNYLSVFDVINPMHRLWSDGRWNKLTLAHGCYWGRCTFCDTSLDYISRYVPMNVKGLCDQMEELIRKTGQAGFHFVDEAAPPALMRDLALEIIRRKLSVVWWTNIRFEKSFTADLCYLLKESGCIAVSGGLEVAADRLLSLINKGVTISQVAKVTNNFTRAGIMVHAYLMYGFPTQTAQETIDSLEVVRQLFEAGIVQSGFWHQFAMTAHSPVGLHPERFKVKIENKKPGTFANNDLIHSDPTGAEHEQFSEGLRKSIFNYMNGAGFEIPLDDWFDFKVPQTKVKPCFISDVLEEQSFDPSPPHAKMIWLGGVPSLRLYTRKKKNQTFEMAGLTFANKKEEVVILVKKSEGEWLYHLITNIMAHHLLQPAFGELEKGFEAQTGGDFILFWNSPAIKVLRKNGLLLL